MGSRSDYLTRLYARLDPPPRGALDRLLGLAGDAGVAVYLVGGAVRDLLLGRDTVDLDLALETDVGPLAKALAAATGSRAVHHEKFGTAVVRGAGFRIDLARTRRETYERPGALPTVAPALLADDLARRDFTVNAMALRLTPPAGEVIDPFGGEKDLGARLVRALHERSFEDDATRMLRAARYAARLSFAIEDSTARWLRRDLDYLSTVSGARLRRELSLLLEEDTGPEGTLLAAGLGVLSGVHPLLGIDDALAERWQDTLDGPHYAGREELGYCLVSRARTEAEVEALSKRLSLTARVRQPLLDLVRLQVDSDKLASVAESPADAVDLLDGRGAAAVWAMSLRGSGLAGRTCAEYLRSWRRVRPVLRGDDLLSMGLSGPAVGEALRALRRARLEWRTTTREDEENLVRSKFGRPG